MNWTVLQRVVLWPLAGPNCVECASMTHGCLLTLPCRRLALGLGLHRQETGVCSAFRRQFGRSRRKSSAANAVGPKRAGPSR